MKEIVLEDGTRLEIEQITLNEHPTRKLKGVWRMGVASELVQGDLIDDETEPMYNGEPWHKMVRTPDELERLLRGENEE